MTTRHDEQTPEPVPGPEAGDLASAARRRALLKGLGKGVALAGAATPLSSLATYGDRKKLYKKSDGKHYHCSVSGHMSVMLSAGITEITSCQHKKWDHYKDKSKWPTTKWVNNSRKPACYFGTVKRHCDEKFFACFGWGSTTKSLYDCINVSAADEHTDWVCAVLNANFSTHNYPYTSEQVLNHSKGLGGISKADAHYFHQRFSRDAW